MFISAKIKLNICMVIQMELALTFKIQMLHWIFVVIVLRF